MVKIGYAGRHGSDAEVTAGDLARRSMLREPELVRLGSAAEVVSAMESHDVDYGVFPFRDSERGDVPETAAATDGKHCLILGTAWCLMPRSVFARPGEKVGRVLADADTMDMCQSTISKLYGDIETVISGDPVGDVSEGCAVVCRKEEGVSAGLECVCDDARDDSGRMLQFMIAKLV